jgi:hypothetical protein
LVFRSADAPTRAKIDRLVQVWLDRAVFPSSVISALQAALRTTGAMTVLVDDNDSDESAAAATTTTTSSTAASASAAIASSSDGWLDASVADDVQATRLATQVAALSESMLDVPLESKSRPIVGLAPAQLRQRLSRTEARRQLLMRVADALDARCTRRESAIVAANAVVARQTARLVDERRVALRVKAWLDSTNALVERLDAQVNLAPDYGDDGPQAAAADDNDDDDNNNNNSDDVALAAAAERLASLEARASLASDALSSSQAVANPGDKLMQLIETDLFGDENDKTQDAICLCHHQQNEQEL